MTELIGEGPNQWQTGFTVADLPQRCISLNSYSYEELKRKGRESPDDAG